MSTQRLNVEFSFEIEGGSGADGLALVVARNLLDDPILGSGGSGGCGGCFASPQFVDGIAVEFDTHPNAWDISGNHAGISLLGGDSPVALAAVNVEHELRHNGIFNAEVMFDNGRVQVHLSNPGLGMDRTLLLDHTIPDFDLFQGYLGFVGTTGGATDRHVIHNVHLEQGNRPVVAAPTPAPGQDAAPFARKPLEDFDNLRLPVTADSGEGMWSDGTTIWLVETTDDKLYAFDLSTKLRKGPEHFHTLRAADNTSPESNWSDGTTMWVAETDRIFAYSMSTKERVPDEDFNTLRPAGNIGAEGIWSDGVTLWVADHDHHKLFAYNLDTKERVPDEDFNTLGDAGNNWAVAIWSNGATMWVSDWTDDKLYAYDMKTKQRVPDLDFNTLGPAGNNTPEGIWANTETMWVRDSEDGKLYAYQMPPGPKPPVAPTVTTPIGGWAAHPNDVSALKALYEATGGPNWNNSDDNNWLTTTSIDRWQGVQVDRWSGRVTSLTLANNNLGGPLPPELGDLDALIELRLNGNDLSGPIPPELSSSQLSNLKLLNLSDNQLSGEIPASLADLPNLETLWIENNELTGCIPQGLKGIVEEGLPQRVRGIRFDLPDFCLPPVAPEEQEALDKEKEALRLLFTNTGGEDWVRKDGWIEFSGKTEDQWHDADLTGWDGVEIDKKGFVVELNLSENNLKGQIPARLFLLERLRVLDLSKNQLGGVIPQSLSMLENLSDTRVRLYGNKFEGCAPRELSRKLEASYLNRPIVQGDGGLQGSLDIIGTYFPSQVKDWISEFLNELGLVQTFAEARGEAALESIGRYEGKFPDNWRHNLAQEVVDNSIEGKLQTWGQAHKIEGDLASWGRVSKVSNFLTPIFELYAILTSEWFQRWVEGSSSAYWGLEVPPCAPSMGPYAPETSLLSQSLETDKAALLAIRNYYLSLDTTDGITNLGEYHNNYTFTSSDSFWGGRNFNWPDQGKVENWHGVSVEDGRVVRLEIMDRLLEGGIPPEMGDLGALKTLNLSRNRLSGPLPPELGNLVLLETLSLNGKDDLCGADYRKSGRDTILDGHECDVKRLNGEIPLELGNLKKLEHLFLHENNLEGDLPLELGNAEGLEQVNFAGTKIGGCVPPNLQHYYGTPIIAEFLADVSHAAAWMAVGTVFPVGTAVAGTIDFFTGGHINTLTGWVIKKPVKFVGRVFKEGARDSNLAGVDLYCE